jgi:hypothetical protein
MTDIDFKRTAALRGLKRLYVRVLSISPHVPSAAELHRALTDHLKGLLVKGRLEVLPESELRSDSVEPVLIYDPRILPVPGMSTAAAGFIAAADLSLHQRVMPWDNPTDLISAITWRACGVGLLLPGDDLRGTLLKSIEGWVNAFLADVQVAATGWQ